MTDPSYTTKWRCKECGSLYGHNPSECDVCGHTLFRPVPADGATATFSGGEEETELGGDVSELVDRIDRDEPTVKTDTEPEKSTDETDADSEESTGGIDAETGERSLLGRLLPW